jgi:lipoate-protein ligase A
MGEMWRVLDTGLRSAAQNIALDRALLEARNAEEIGSTLRFCRFAPSALLACRQSAAQEFDLDFCSARDIAVQRRISGGEAIYCDGAQLGWALYLHQRDVGTFDMQTIARRVCHAVAAAVGALGLDARFRARGDIEIDGRQIGSAGGTFDGDALLYQGILQIDRDVATMVRAMHTPAGTVFEQAAAAARDRVTDLKNALSERPATVLVRGNIIAAFESEFAVEFHDGDLSLTEHARYQSALAEIDAPDWINFIRRPASEVTVCAAAQKLAGGVLNANLVYDSAGHRIRQVWFAHDTPIEPRRVIADLEAALSGTTVERLERNVHAFFAGRAVAMPGLTPGDFVAVVRRALKLPLVTLHP